MTQTWLYRAGLCALILLPVAHLTSLGVMEMAGFLLLLASLGLFLSEYLTDAPAALNRIRSRVALPILGYSMVTIMSAWVMLESAEDQLSALRELKWVLYLFAFAYFFERYFTEAWARYLPVLATLVALMGALSLVQFVYGLEYPRAESVLEQWGDYYRVTGLFNVPQSFAGNLGLALFMLLGVTLSQMNGGETLTARLAGYRFVAVLLGVLGLLLSLTRAAWLASAVVGMLALSRVRKRWRVVLLLMIAALAGLGSNSETIIGDRFSGEIDRNERSILHREALWEANWEMTKDYPWLGIGPWQNVRELPTYYQRTQPDDASYIGHAHNNVLQVLASQGIFSALCYLGFCAFFLWAAYSLSQREMPGSLVHGLAWGSLYAQIFFHLLGMVDSPFFDQEVKNMIVFIWALTFALHQRARRGVTLNLENSQPRL